MESSIRKIESNLDILNKKIDLIESEIDNLEMKVSIIKELQKDKKLKASAEIEQELAKILERLQNLMISSGIQDIK